MPNAPKRRRLKNACQPCRQRKRKCDGCEPCGTCVRLEYDCFYSQPKTQRNTPKAPATAQLRAHKSSDSGGAASTVESRRLDPVDANSGAFLTTTLGLNKNSARPLPLRLFAWNLGLRRSTSAPLSANQPLTALLTQARMEELAAVYFREVQPVYGILDQHVISHDIKERWASEQANSTRESLLAGIAVLGCFFSNESLELEFQLSRLLRAALDPSVMCPYPSENDVVAWWLSAFYLRLAGTPHEVWMATCTMMHILEAAGLHLEIDRDSSLSMESSTQKTQLRRRTYCVCKLFHNWICFDYGRTRVDIRGSTSQLPEPDPSFCSYDLIQMYLLSEKLVPGQTESVRDLETAFDHSLSLHPSHPMLVLIQCNIILCVYRRLRASNAVLTPQRIEQLLEFIDEAVDAAVELFEARLPWWHVSNMTFQAICALITIDTPKSLSNLSKPIKALDGIRQVYQTDEMKDAWVAAQELLRLHRKQKEQDILKLDQLIEPAGPSHVPMIEGVHHPLISGHNFSDGLTYGWNDYGEWEQFLNIEAIFSST